MPRPTQAPIPLRLAVPLVALASLGACVVDQDQAPIGTAEAASITTTSLDVGYGIQRFQEKTCGTRCVLWTDEDTAGGITRMCWKWAPDCGGASTYVGLFARAVDLGTTRMFPAVHLPAGGTRAGCGPWAADNLLSFYGVDLPIETVHGAIPTYQFPFTDQIATTPGDLADGLQALLDQYGDGDFDVAIYHHVTAEAIKGALAGGAPVIILSEGGTHYLTAVGYWGAPGIGGTFAVLDNDRSKLMDATELRLDVPVEIPGTSYQSGTIITVHHSNPVCECKPGAERACGTTGFQQYCDPSTCSWSGCQVPTPPAVTLEHTGCWRGTNTFAALVSPTGTVSVTSYDEQVRIGGGSWTALTSNLVRASAGQSVSVRAAACNDFGCSGYASTTVPGPTCSSGGGIVVK